MNFREFKTEYFKIRYRFAFAGLFVVVIYSFITAWIIGEKYAGLGETETLSDLAGNMMKTHLLLLLFYPILFLVLSILVLSGFVQNKEYRAGIWLFMLSTLLVFLYMSFYYNSSMLYITPLLMILGAVASHMGDHKSLRTGFIVFFVIMLFAFGVVKIDEYYS